MKGGLLARKEGWAGLFFASPWVIGFCVFLLYPLVASIYFSFCDYSVLKAPVFIGTENYQGLMHDELFWKTVANTAIYAAMALPTGLLTSLILAILLNSKVKGMAIYRTIFFIPSLVPQVSMAVLWLWILNGEHGILNHLIATFLHFNGPNWLDSEAWTKPSMVLMALWGAGNSVLIYLASLQDVPTALIEASDLDGASPWQKMLNVTLPMISPVILFNLIMGIIGTLQVFTIPYIMFQDGKPARASYFYTTYLYENAFTYHKMGYACAMGWIMFVVILALTFFSLRLSERHVHYQGG